MVNICTQHTIAKIEAGDFEEVRAGITERNMPAGLDVFNLDAYDASVSTHILRRARALVTGLRAAGQRKEALQEFIIEGNKQRYFFSTTFNKASNKWVQTLCHVPLLELLHDVPTRWDSTYAMVHWLLELRPVSPSPCMTVCHCH